MILLNWRNSQNYDEMELGAIYETSKGVITCINYRIGMWLGCSSSEMIWEFLRNRNWAESTVAYCEEKANIVFGCINSNRTSRVQEIVCPSAQHERDLNRRNTVPSFGKHILGKVWISWRRSSENSKNHHGAKKTWPVRMNELRLHHQKGNEKKSKTCRYYELLVHKLLQGGREHRVPNGSDC